MIDKIRGVLTLLVRSRQEKQRSSEPLLFLCPAKSGTSVALDTPGISRDIDRIRL